LAVGKTQKRKRPLAQLCLTFIIYNVINKDTEKKPRIPRKPNYHTIQDINRMLTFFLYNDRVNKV